MRVAEELEVLDLAADLAHHVQAADLLAVQDLHRHLVLGQLMLAHWETGKTRRQTGDVSHHQFSNFVRQG